MRSIVIFCNMMLGLLIFITSSNCAHANSAPEMTVNGEMGTRGFIDVFELNTFVVDVITSDDTDSEGSGLTYSLTPEPYIRDGVTLPEDNDDFTIDANTGVLRFKLSPDFEVPTDSNGDNVYSINIKVTDSGGLSDYFFLIVQVFDTDESQPTISIYAPSGHNAQPFDVSIGSNKSFDHIKPQLTDVVVTNGTAAKRNNDPLLELTVTPSGNSPVTITIPGGSITDEITGQIVTEVTQVIVPFDVTPPSITSIVRLQNSPTSADSLMWRITLSEYVRVTGLGSALSVTGTTALVQPTLVDTISLGALQTGVKVFDVTISGGDLANLEDNVVLNFDPVAAGLKDAANLSFVSSVPTGANEITYFVTQDNVAPTLTPVTIYSDNADPTVAVPGDTVTVKFSASEALVSPPPAVTIAGQSASLIGVSPNFKATLLVDATTPKGVASFSISGFQDVAGNPGAAVTATTDGSAVTIATAGPSVEETQKVISEFMGNRANHILGNQPDIASFVDGTNTAGGGELGFLGINANEEGMELAFSTSRSKILASMQANRVKSLDGYADRLSGPQVDKRIKHAFVAEDESTTYALQKTDSEEGEETGVSSYDRADHSIGRAGTWDIWTEIYGSRTTAGTSDSSLWVGYLGLHAFVTDHMLVGVLGQLDWADETNSTVNSNADGFGWMVGPYIAGKVPNQNLYYEARASWGRSSNDISPDGTYTDNFDTTRWLASAKLSGSHQMGDVTIRPEARISWFEETHESYVDSISQTISEQTISLGEVRFGPTITRSITLDDGTLVQPSIGISGVWNFGIQDNAASQGFALGNGDLRARFNGGLSATNSLGWKLTLTGFYDGIGISNYDSYGGSVRLTVPLN